MSYPIARYLNLNLQDARDIGPGASLPPAQNRYLVSIMPPRTANVCFTINNYTPNGLAAMTELLHGGPELQITRETRVTYLAFQREVGESGTPHLQGYLQLERSISIVKVTDWLNSIVGTPVHTEKTMGSSDQANEYVTKEDSRLEGTVPFIYGELIHHEAARGQGTRTDLADVKTAIEQGESIVNLKSQYFDQFARYGQFLTQYKIEWDQRSIMTELKDSTALEQLRSWQKDCLEIVTSMPSDRKVRWFWENVGNVGKSWMGRYLTLHHDALILGAMKKLDLLHAIAKTIQGKKVVVFDLTRSNEEGAVKVIYEVIEQLLNRVIHSGKYDSQTIFIQKVHILVFANFEPDRASMSHDRWDVHHIASV